MARLHSKKHGKSGSRKPVSRVVPDWVEYKAHEVEELVVKLGKEGISPTAIGLKLRDQYGIPSVQTITHKSVSQVLQDGGVKVEYPDDVMSLIERAMRMRAHLKTNKQDMLNRTKLLHVESKIKRLAKYYTTHGQLPADWKYDPAKAALLVK